MSDFQDILREAIGKKTRELANHLDKKYWMVRKYAQALNASGWPLPAHLLPEVCRFLDNDAPLRYLAAKVGLILFRPSINISNGRGCRDVAELCRRFASCLDCYADIFQDGAITESQATEFRKQAFGLIEGTLAINKAVEIKSSNNRGPVARKPRTQTQKRNSKIASGPADVKQNPLHSGRREESP